MDYLAGCYTRRLNYKRGGITMNLCEAVVKEIIGESYQKFGYWFRNVKYESYGCLDEMSIMFKTKEEADNVIVGYKFDC